MGLLGGQHHRDLFQKPYVESWAQQTHFAKKAGVGAHINHVNAKGTPADWNVKDLPPSIRCLHEVHSSL